MPVASSLAATALTEFWGEHPDKLVLWPAAVRNGIIQEYPNYNFDIKPNLFTHTGKNAHFQAHLKCKKLTFDLFDIIYPALNKIHDVELSSAFWKPVLLCFLYRYVSILYDKYLSLSTYCTAPNLETVLLSEKNYHIPDSLGDFDQFTKTDFGAQQMVSEYFRAFPLGDTSEVDYAYQRETKQVSGTTPASILKALRSGQLSRKAQYRFLNDIWYRRVSPRMIISGAFFNSSVFSELLKQSHGKIKVVPTDDSIGAEHRTTSSQMRDRLDVIKLGDDPFSHYLRRSMKHFFPTTLLEGFTDLLACANDTLENYPDAEYLVCESWINTDSTAFLAGLCGEGGIKLLHPQHGFQFMNKGNFNWLPETVADKYLSSGWKGPRLDSNILPAGSGKDYRLEPHVGEDCILYISGAGWLYPSLIYDVFSGDDWILYRTKQKQFFNALPPEIRRATRFRHHKYTGWELVKPHPEVEEQYSAAMSLSAAMAQSKITIIDHMSTPFMDAMAQNFPCLVIADKDLYGFCEEYSGLFDGLIEAGVLHTSFASATEKLIEINNNVEKWWQSEPVKIAVETFRDNNVRPASELIKVLLKMVE